MVEGNWRHCALKMYPATLQYSCQITFSAFIRLGTCQAKTQKFLNIYHMYTKVRWGHWSISFLSRSSTNIKRSLKKTNSLTSWNVDSIKFDVRHSLWTWWWNVIETQDIWIRWVTGSKNLNLIVKSNLGI